MIKMRVKIILGLAVHSNDAAQSPDHPIPQSPLSFFASPAIKAETSSIRDWSSVNVSSFRRSTRNDASICVSSSLSEPDAWLRNSRNSLLDFLPAPSAKLLGTDKAALLIWETSPNNSSRGKFRVARYISTYKSIPLCHAKSERCGLISKGYVNSPSSLNHLIPQSLNHLIPQSLNP